MLKSLFTAALISIATIAIYSRNDFKEAFLTRWQHMESYTLEMYDAIPDSLMSYRPVEGVRSIHEQFLHVARHLSWISDDFLAVKKVESLFDPNQMPIREALEKAFKLVRERVGDLNETDLTVKAHFRPANRELSRYELLYLLLDHTRNHTGQLVVYMRLNGLQPMRYQGW